MKVKILKEFTTEKGIKLRAGTKGYIDDALASKLVREGYAKPIVSVSTEEISETVVTAKEKLKAKKTEQA